MTCKQTKRLLWIPTVTTLAGSVAVAFSIIQKTPCLHSLSDSGVCSRNFQAL